MAELAKAENGFRLVQIASTAAFDDAVEQHRGEDHLFVLICAEKDDKGFSWYAGSNSENFNNLLCFTCICLHLFDCIERFKQGAKSFSAGEFSPF